MLKIVTFTLSVSIKSEQAEPSTCAWKVGSNITTWPQLYKVGVPWPPWTLEPVVYNVGLYGPVQCWMAACRPIGELDSGNWSQSDDVWSVEVLGFMINWSPQVNMKLTLRSRPNPILASGQLYQLSMHDANKIQRWITAAMLQYFGLPTSQPTIIKGEWKMTYNGIL